MMGYKSHDWLSQSYMCAAKLLNGDVSTEHEIIEWKMNIMVNIQSLLHV